MLAFEESKDSTAAKASGAVKPETIDWTRALLSCELPKSSRVLILCGCLAILSIAMIVVGTAAERTAFIIPFPVYSLLVSAPTLLFTSAGGVFSVRMGTASSLKWFLMCLLAVGSLLLVCTVLAGTLPSEGLDSDIIDRWNTDLTPEDRARWNNDVTVLISAVNSDLNDIVVVGAFGVTFMLLAGVLANALRRQIRFGSREAALEAERQAKFEKRLAQRKESVSMGQTHKRKHKHKHKHKHKEKPHMYTVNEEKTAIPVVATERKSSVITPAERRISMMSSGTDQVGGNSSLVQFQQDLAARKEARKERRHRKKREKKKRKKEKKQRMAAKPATAAVEPVYSKSAARAAGLSVTVTRGAAPPTDRGDAEPTSPFTPSVVDDEVDANADHERRRLQRLHGNVPSPAHRASRELGSHARAGSVAVTSLSGSSTVAPHVRGASVGTGLPSGRPGLTPLPPLGQPVTGVGPTPRPPSSSPAQRVSPRVAALSRASPTPSSHSAVDDAADSTTQVNDKATSQGSGLVSLLPRHSHTSDDLADAD